MNICEAQEDSGSALANENRFWKHLIVAYVYCPIRRRLDFLNVGGGAYVLRGKFCQQDRRTLEKQRSLLYTTQAKY